MKRNQNELDGILTLLSFPSKILDNDYKNINTISTMFDDGQFTKTKLEGFRNLIGLKKMDYAYIYILAKIITSDSPQSEFCCYDFSISPIIADRILLELANKNYLLYLSDFDKDIGSTFTSWYTLSPTLWATLVAKGSLKDLNLTNIDTPLKSEPKNKYILSVNDIQDVTLYYSDSVNKSLSKIKNIFKNENLENVQKRILEDNQHAGICISFYGPSGTGKTEEVLQLAKQSGRDVYNYKIADSESRYCGDRQNIINKMFDDFKSLRLDYIKENKPEPILLLNEADALFSKRHGESDENNTANRENNQMQAELLNHIENFDGIMIITTNLIQNFDDAMERRFLFKVKFDNPDKETQKAIWKNRFPFLKEDDLKSIVDKYDDFTGGNIQNIKKKSSIEYVISGKKANLKMLLELCKDEKVDKENVKKIGFGA